MEPNIKDVNKIPELKEKIYEIFGFKINITNSIGLDNMNSLPYIYDADNNMLIICTWLGRLRQEYTTMIECDMISYNKTYKNMINDINNDLKINLKYDDTLSLDIYPSVPSLNIDK